MLRQPRGELDDAMVQERRPHFERMRHAHAVALVEDVVWQIVALVEPEIAIEVSSLRRSPAGRCSTSAPTGGWPLRRCRRFFSASEKVRSRTDAHLAGSRNDPCSMRCSL